MGIETTIIQRASRLSEIFVDRNINIDPNILSSTVSSFNTATSINIARYVDHTSFIAAVLNDVGIAPSLIASVFNESDLSLLNIRDIYNSPSLTATKLRDALAHTNLTEARRVNILHLLNNLGSRTPTLSGTWEASPINLINITDGDNISSCGTGSVFRQAGGSSEGFINIDIGEVRLIKTISARWNTSLIVGGWAAANTRLQISADGTTWTTIADSLIFNDVITVNASIRFVRLQLVVVAGNAASEWGRNTLNSCNFILG